MLKVVIIEDEVGAAQNLGAILAGLPMAIQVLAILDSLTDAIDWLATNPSPDLGFFDIQLADGSSFEIFRRTQVGFPVIFTTAYDQYAIDAFKVNSIDYLLKPIQAEAVEQALNKYQSLQPTAPALQQLLAQLQPPAASSYRQSFLLAHRDQLIPLAVHDCAYFHVEHAQCFVYTQHGQRFPIDQSLEQLEAELEPQAFFRANRQFLISRSCIQTIHLYFNGRLLLGLQPSTNKEVMISKARASVFKAWMGK